MKSENGNFRNRTTQRFYEYLHGLVEKGLVTQAELAEAFGVYQSNPRNFLNNLKKGVTQVSAEMIEIASEKFGLNPADLFSDQAFDGAASASSGEFRDGGEFEYGVMPYSNREAGQGNMQRLGKVLKQMLAKHSIKVDPYCRNYLGISRTFYYNMESGRSHIPLDLAVRICEDLGESLDIFCSKPMPIGHLQTELELMKLRLEECLKDKKKS